MSLIAKLIQKYQTMKTEKIDNCMVCNIRNLWPCSYCRILFCCFCHASSRFL